ncbi:MAG: carboxypeptidase regulatory-like domain-containing protein [Desulfurococcales archaeon]|nr:carboxypeptidase regulatory-like domain-containing protein [Desulfurococcales archaeon]
MNAHRILAALFLVVLMILPLAPLTLASPLHPYDNQAWLEKFHPALLSKVISGEINDDDVITAVFRLKPLPSYTQYLVRGDYDKAVNTLKTWASMTQAPFITEVYKMNGKVLNTFWIDNVVLVKAKLSVIKDLASYPGVVEVFENFQVHVIEPVSKQRVKTSSTVESWGIFKINATDAWSLGYTGEGIRIAVLDTGVDITHPALQGKMLTLDPTSPYYPGGWMEFDDNGNPVLSEPHDTDGHGTHTSGTALGGDTSDVLIGVAPDATLMHGLILPGGGGTFAQVLAGIQWAVEPFYIDPDTSEIVYTGLPAHVISMSLGASGYYGTELFPGIEAALLANIIVVAAIGNDGPGISSNPGNIWGVFGIGATDEYDQVAYFSSGEVVNWPDPPTEWPFYNTYPSSYIKPDFSAPGVDITSSVPGGGYESWSGTSMATPHAAGTVALILQASGWYENPVDDLPEKVYEILQNASVDLGDPGQDIYYGYGRIDTLTAVEIAQSYAKTSGVQGLVLDSEDYQPIPWTQVYVVEINKTYPVRPDGTFKIPLDPGTYTLVFSAWGYQEKTVVVEVIVSNGTVAGYVYDSVTMLPVSGAEVSLVEAGISTYTNDTGFFEISVQPGTYTLEVYASGYNLFNTSVTVRENETTIVAVPLTPLGSGTIEGFVYDNSTGLPIANATVVVDGGVLFTYTGPDGYYNLTNVPAGPHVITVYAPGYMPATENITLAPNQTLVLDFYLEPIPPTVIVLGNIDYYTEPHLAMLLSGIGYPVLEYDDVALLLSDWANGYINPVAIVVDHFKPNKYDDPTLEEVLGLLVMADFTNTPLIFLATSFSGTTAIDALYLYSNDIVSAGYPAPIAKSYDYPSPEYVRVNMLVPSHPIFDGVVPDNDTWFYLADLDLSFYADYVVYDWNTSVPVTPIAEIVDDYYGVNGTSIAVWTTPGGATWIYMASFGESYWMQYIDPGSDGLYSNNTELVLMNAVAYAIATRPTTTPNKPLPASIITSLQKLTPSTIEPSLYTNITVLLDRLPYGYVEGTIAGSDNALLAGAKIVVLGTPIEVYAGTGGYFKFWLPAGNYTLEISMPGYKTTYANVTVQVNETTQVGQIILQYVPRIAILYDYQGELKNIIQDQLGWYAEDLNDPYSFAEALYSGFFNAGIWAGYYYAPFPSYDEFYAVWNAINDTGISVIFMDQWSSPWYPDLFGYGINAMYNYLSDPSTRIVDDFYGEIYIQITEASPLFEGYNVGDIVKILEANPGGWGTDYAAFSGFSGTTLAKLMLGDGSIPGDAIAYKVLDNGAKIILLASWAPEEYQDIEFWTPDAYNIFLNAVKWAAAKPFNVTPSEVNATVGDTVEFQFSDLPADYQVNVYLDGEYLLSVTTDRNGTATVTFTVPLIPGGKHSVAFVGSDEIYRAYASLTVMAKLEITPMNTTSPGTLEINATGLEKEQMVYLYMDGNFISILRSDANGQILTTVNVPFVASGEHCMKIVGLDGSTIAKSKVYVESLIERIYGSVGSASLEDILYMIQSMNMSITSIITDEAGNIYALVSNNSNQVLYMLDNVQNLITTSTNNLQNLINDLNGSLQGLIQDEAGNIYALINTTSGQILVKLDDLSTQISQAENNILDQLSQLQSLLEQNVTQLSSQLEETQGTASTGVRVGGVALVAAIAGIVLAIRGVKP